MQILLHQEIEWYEQRAVRVREGVQDRAEDKRDVAAKAERVQGSGFRVQGSEFRKREIGVLFL